MPTKFAWALAMMALIATTASRAEGPAPKSGTPASMTAISPIFGQLVRFSMPSKFTGVSEETRDAFYIREAVLKGETLEAWTQMITITGSRGMAGIANFSPQKLAARIALGFKKACPESFALKDLGETKLGEQDAYMAVAACGKVNSSADGHSETALIVAVGGSTDAYTVQWAERRPQARSSADIDVAGAVARADADPAVPDRRGRGRALSKLPAKELATARLFAPAVGFAALAG
jgi:hypothetical protein